MYSKDLLLSPRTKPSATAVYSHGSDIFMKATSSAVIRGGSPSMKRLPRASRPRTNSFCQSLTESYFKFHLVMKGVMRQSWNLSSTLSADFDKLPCRFHTVHVFLPGLALMPVCFTKLSMGFFTCLTLCRCSLNASTQLPWSRFTWRLRLLLSSRLVFIVRWMVTLSWLLSRAFPNLGEAYVPIRPPGRFTTAALTRASPWPSPLWRWSNFPSSTHCACGRYLGQKRRLW